MENAGIRAAALADAARRTAELDELARASAAAPPWTARGISREAWQLEQVATQGVNA